MMAVSVDQSELDRQSGFLLANVGAAGSGSVRYAAAMYFYNLDMMPAPMLEIYRMCSKFDREDPIDLAKFEGVELPQFAKTRHTGRRA
jgi:hypothetical protein